MSEKKGTVLLSLALSMLKIGAFSFGGGYGMIPLFENEFVVKKKWMDSEEFPSMIAIAESTPGPIAINCATYIGCKIAGVAGAAISTVAVCLPSFLIIYVISLFLDAFLALEVVARAFRGIRVCVAFLIFRAGIGMLRDIKKDRVALVLCAVILILTTLLSVFAVDFSTILLILAGGVLGLVWMGIRKIGGKK